MGVSYEDLIGLLNQTPYMSRNPAGDMFTLGSGITGLDLGSIDPRYVSTAGNFQFSPEQFIQALGSGALGYNLNNRRNMTIQNQDLFNQILGGQNVAMGGGMSPEALSELMLQSGGALAMLSGGAYGGGDPLGSYNRPQIRGLGMRTDTGPATEMPGGSYYDNPFYQNDAYARALQGAGYNINAPQRPAPAPTQPLPGQGGGWNPGDRNGGGGSMPVNPYMQFMPDWMRQRMEQHNASVAAGNMTTMEVKPWEMFMQGSWDPWWGPSPEGWTGSTNLPGGHTTDMWGNPIPGATGFPSEGPWGGGGDGGDAYIGGSPGWYERPGQGQQWNPQQPQQGQPYQPQPIGQMQQGGGYGNQTWGSGADRNRGMPGDAGGVLPFNPGNQLGNLQNQQNRQFNQDKQRLRGNPYAQGGGQGQGNMPPPWMYGAGMMGPWGNQMMGGANPWQHMMPWAQSPWWQQAGQSLPWSSPFMAGAQNPWAAF
jgi:hypothetical protein